MTHASALKLRPGQSRGEAQSEDAARAQGYVSRRRSESYAFRLAPGHGIGAVTFDESRLRRDLAIAQSIGAEAVDYVKERHAKLVARAKSVTKPEGFVFGTCFPNMTFQGHGAFEGELLALAHPRGPRLSEIWQWLFVERDAPASVIRRIARDTSQRQSAGGLIGQDDGENFERIEESSRGAVALGLSFNYAMAKERDDNHLDVGGAAREGWPVEGVAGEPSRSNFSETNQREFYRRWAQVMAPGGAPA